MNKKVCPACDKPSYSAKTMGKWLCPKCNYDLTNKPCLPLNDLDRGRGTRPMAFSVTKCITKPEKNKPFLL